MRLRSLLPALTAVLPARRVVLFGSWATGRATAFSDIDLLIEYDDPPRDNAFQLAKRVFLSVRGVEPHVYAGSEAARMRPTIDRMAGGGILLFDADA